LERGRRCRSSPPFGGAELREDMAVTNPRLIKPSIRRIVLIAVTVAMCTIGLVCALGQFGNTVCAIKGNISSSSGERIYHVPGQRYYDKTIINWSKGERWFCTEQEAVRAGWRKAKV